MSLLNKASLVLTPNAVKEQKLYSIIPNNGNGDMVVSRATTATRVNSQGFIEESPYNLATYSNDFSNASWSKVNIAIVANTITSPNGDVDADTLIGDGILNNHNLQKDGTLISGSSYTTSIYAKKGTNNFIQIIGSATIYNAGVFANFDLNNGLVGSVGTSTTANITNVGNGWYRCTITSTAISNTIAPIFIATLITSATSIRFEQNTLSTSVYIWGAQLVQGSTPKDYFQTTNRLNVPRLNYDTAGGCPSILLEPQRTNLLTYSTNFNNAVWETLSATKTVNTAVSPDNTINACRFLTLAADASYLYVSALAIVTSTVYTVSVWAKSNAIGLNTFRLYTTAAGTSGNFTTTNTWQRFSYTFTSTGAVTNIGFRGIAGVQTDILIWGAQLEVGAYPTSYIPTIASTVTRAADNISRSNIYTNGLITSAGGTWYVELNNNFIYQRDNGSYSLFISDAPTSPVNGFTMRTISGTTQRLTISKRVSSTETTLYPTTTDTVKIAIKWNGTTADVFVNGVKVVTSTAFSATNMEYLKASAEDVTKYIKSTMLFPTPLSDGELAQLTFHI